MQIRPAAPFPAVAEKVAGSTKSLSHPSEMCCATVSLITWCVSLRSRHVVLEDWIGKGRGRGGGLGKRGGKVERRRGWNDKCKVQR